MMSHIYQATEENERRHGSTSMKPASEPSLDGRLPDFFFTDTPALGGFDAELGLCQPVDSNLTTVVKFRDCHLDQRYASTPCHAQHLYSPRNLGICTVPCDDDLLLRKPLLFLAKQKKFKRIETILTFMKLQALAIWLEDFRPVKNLAGLQETGNGTTMLHMIMEYRPPATLVNLLILKLSELHNGFVSEDATDVRGRTALHLAVQYCCDSSVIERLVSGLMSFAPAATKDFSGRLPLHWACENPRGLKTKGWRLLSCGDQSEQCINMSEIIELLLKVYPHAVTVKDCKGRTPLNLALENGADHETALHLVQVNRKLNSERSSTSANTGNESESDVADFPVSFTEGTGYQPYITDIEDDMSSIGSGGVSRHTRNFSRTGEPWVYCRVHI